MGSFLTTISIKKHEIAVFEDPYLINVYAESSTTINNESFYEGDEVYKYVSKYLKETLTTSLFTIMVNDGKLIEKPIYDENIYAVYDTTMKQKNIVIEYLYKENKNIVCYQDGNGRVISYACFLMIIPINYEYEDIYVYTSLSNNTTQKEEEYKKSTPFVLKGNPKKLIEYINGLK